MGLKPCVLVLTLIFLCGCAQTYEFGTTDDSSGVKTIPFFSQSRVGMTKKEVQEKIGLPQSRSTDVTYRGKVYQEVWVYNTSPQTILYFKNGVLEHKEYGP